MKWYLPYAVCNRFLYSRLKLVIIQLLARSAQLRWSAT